MCFKQDGGISLLNGKPKKPEDILIYLGNNISSTETYGIPRKDKAWTDTDRLSTIWKSENIKW